MQLHDSLALKIKLILILRFPIDRSVGSVMQAPLPVS